MPRKITSVTYCGIITKTNISSKVVQDPFLVNGDLHGSLCKIFWKELKDAMSSSPTGIILSSSCIQKQKNGKSVEEHMEDGYDLSRFHEFHGIL